MNLADSERIEKHLKNQGFGRAKIAKQADLVVINTCVVRQSAENRVYGLINKLAPKSDSWRGPKIIITGCLAGWAAKDKSGKNLKTLRKRIGPKAQIILTEELADFQLDPCRAEPGHAWVPISNGCNNFCSYCIVPHCRGKEVSRPFEEIVKEIKSLVKKGFTKITLLGQNVNSYGADLVKKKNQKVTLVKQLGKKRIPTLFPYLLETIAQIPGLVLIDFISANPWDFSSDLIKVIAKYHHVTRTIHLPVQSGDDQILKAMNRWYTAKEYVKLTEKIRKSIPEVKFTTDIIVGFPGETKEQFKNTVKLVKKVGFTKAYLSRYSPRPGTISSKMEDNVTPKEKKRRWRVLEELINPRPNKRSFQKS